MSYIKSFNKTSKEQRKQIETPLKPCKSFEEGLKIGNNLKTFMKNRFDKNDLGLANNQIGGTKKVCVARLKRIKGNYNEYKWTIFINPKILQTSKTFRIVEECCLSFPNKSNKVKRYDYIIIQHLKDDELITEKFSFHNAQVLQHEIDHLNGIHIFNK